jgi:aminoglycoside phosphotransferase
LQVLAHPTRVLDVMPPSARVGFASAQTILCTPFSYRPGERCTLSLTAQGSGAHVSSARIFAKTFNDDRAVRIGGRLRHLARELQRPKSTLRVPSLFVDALDEHTLWMPELAGTPAIEGLDEAPIARLQTLVAALAELHAVKPVNAPSADRALRLEEASRKVRKLARAFPLAESHGARAVERCAALLPRLPLNHDALCHGDAHLGQFAFLTDGVAMFDADELVRGDLESDLASLAVSVAINSREGIEGVRDALARVHRAYLRAPAASRPIDPRIYEFYRRLQLIDRAYRDYWRHGSVMRFAIEQALRAAAESES